MRLRYPAIALAITVLVACSGQVVQQSVAPRIEADCQGRWAVRVQNDTSEPLDVYYSQGPAGTPLRLGTARAQSGRSFYLRSVPTPTVWAVVGTMQIFDYDRGAQSRHRVYIEVSCDTRD